jgi:hypothetical protein
VHEPDADTPIYSSMSQYERPDEHEDEGEDKFAIPAPAEPAHII